MRPKPKEGHHPSRAQAAWALAVMLSLALAPACRSRGGRRHIIEETTDNTPTHIDVKLFGGNDAVRRQVLTMPWSEITARLKAVRLDVDARFVFDNRQGTLEQADHYTATADAQSNIHVALTTPESELDVSLVGESIFVRYDRGETRRKTRRDMNLDMLTDTVAAATPQALATFGNLAYDDPQTITVEGRSATRYRIRLDAKGGRDMAVTNSQAFAPTWQLPGQPAALARQAAMPQSATGSITLDDATGVVLQCDLDGRLNISEAGMLPTTTVLRLRTRTQDIGRVAPIKTPKHVPEVRRLSRPHDPVAFFREHLPAPVDTP